jgi:hypothetical protein
LTRNPILSSLATSLFAWLPYPRDGCGNSHHTRETLEQKEV